MGIEFRTASTSVMTVNSSSYVRVDFPIVFHLADLISRSNSPPCHRTFSKLNFHITWSHVNALTTSGLSSTFCMRWVADLNVFALSETIKRGIPCLAVKRLKHWINVTALNPMTNSRWTARVEQQVYKHNHVFSPFVVLWSLTYIGLAKSTPVQLNGHDRFTLKKLSGEKIYN